MSIGIPDPNSITDPKVREWAKAITQIVKSMLGELGSDDNRVVTRGELIAIGSIGRQNGKLFRKPITEPPAITDTAKRMSQIIATFDATAGMAIGTHLLDVTLPLGARVTSASLNVGTTFTSATDAAVIGVGIQVDDVAGIVSPIAINNIANPWDAGDHATIQDGNASHYSERTTAAGRALIATVAAEALTAGKFTLNVYYSIG